MQLNYLNSVGHDNISDSSDESKDQSIQSNTYGLTNVTQSSSVTTNVLPPMVIDICDSSYNSDDDDLFDETCRMCHKTIESDRDVGYIDTNKKCNLR